MTIQNHSMLVNMTIHRWTATKHDRSVSNEVERTHQARNAGRYNKQLIDKAHLVEIDRLSNQLRAFHYQHTLPWAEEGARLLPTKLFLTYQSGIFDLREKRDRAVEQFLTTYPQLVNDARSRLNTMFDPADYPSVEKLREKFGVDVEYMPVPNANDFRVDIAHELQEGVRQQMLQSISARQEKMVADCWQRVREVVSRIAEQCSNPKGRIHDSLMENAQSLADVIDGLNITANSDIAYVGEQLRALIVDPDRLRTSPTTRAAVALNAEQILQRIPA